MVVKIPINRGIKSTSEKTLIDSPGTKTTMVTNENERACKFGAAAASAAKKKKRRSNSNHTFSSNNNEGDVGDNSSISSKSSMNSAYSIDRDVRDGIINDVKSTTTAAAANTTAAAASTKVLSSEDCTLTICSPSDQSRDQIDHPYSSSDTLLIGVSAVLCEMYFKLSGLLSHAFFVLLFDDIIGAFTTSTSTHFKVSQFHTSKGLFAYSVHHKFRLEILWQYGKFL